MKMRFKKLVVAMCIASGFSAANAEVCNNLPGVTTCGNGTVENVLANGAVSMNGTTVLKETQINGVLHAENTNFNKLEVNGATQLAQCVINDLASIKGALTASSSKFEKGVTIFSNQTRFINSTIRGDVHIGHTEPSKQIVYLDHLSEVIGNIVFDDGDGEVVLRDQSKIDGKVIGGHITLNNK